MDNKTLNCMILFKEMNLCLNPLAQITTHIFFNTNSKIKYQVSRARYQGPEYAILASVRRYRTSNTTRNSF